jgi:hypothetical protein
MANRLKVAATWVQVGLATSMAALACRLDHVEMSVGDLHPRTRHSAYRDKHGIPLLDIVGDRSVCCGARLRVV